MHVDSLGATSIETVGIGYADGYACRAFTVDTVLRQRQKANYGSDLQ